MIIHCGQRELSLHKPVVMGVLNVTPDSFSDGGQWVAVDVAVERALQMLAEGAAIIDIGGESTRPGADAVDVETELERVLSIIESLRAKTEALLSIDTRKPQVMQAAIAAGADMINDVAALREPGAMAVAAETKAGVCLMHMQGEPGTMQADPQYGSVVSEVCEFLLARRNACLAAGISADRLMIDPGFGFGKSLQHNYELLAGLADLQAVGSPVLVGMSRKSMLGKVIDAPPDQRLAAGVAAAVLAAERGASVIRTHDVKATADALKIVEQLSAD